MSEIGGITELQLLQAEIAILQKVLQGVQQGEPVSKAGARFVGNIVKAAPNDDFITKEGMSPHASTSATNAAGAAPSSNPYHSAASGAASEGGCCAVQ